jgi:hypothetical protein
MWFWLMILACLSTVNILYRKELILIKFQHMEFIKISDWILDLIEPEDTDSGRPQAPIMVQFKKNWGILFGGLKAYTGA